MTRANPFRFSTKHQDDETDLLYYGYRYYNASTGMWLSHDPIGERGGRNLYSLSGNQAVGKYDALGLWPRDTWEGFLCLPCKCLNPVIEYNPGGTMMELDWYRDRNGHEVFGNQVHVTWQVLGNPRKCRYFQEEGETVTVVTDPYGDVHYGPGTSGERSQSYWDFMHVGPFPDSRYDGNYHITVYWAVIFRCQSSSGENITRIHNWTVNADFQVPHSIVR